MSRSAVASAVVVDRETGDTILAENADRPFAAGSLVKLLIGWDALHRHRGDKMVRDRVFKMIQASDDPTASSFWVSEGGTSIITRTRTVMGLRSTEPPVPSTRWGNTTVTANDMARIYDYIMTQAEEFERDTILDAMKTASKAGADGFKQHFGIPSATKPPWAVKQAWATDSEDHRLTHSTGFVGENLRYVVIVLTEHPPGQSWDVATRSVTAGAAAIMSKLE
ncbi:hypothetical protein JOF56_000525 [Kibdelosporangium banguiense]|uniref:Serine hydrolase n=1 Tax=Kibdelosporangium banguiense TaxID=1365924 RepID=A0ABS4T6U6_9PSEU|nr:hypothetical protein [Kibdelosporangium banguiense]MBP2320140.1 hypothetical protein [Kibdelosporangium banguiense]